MRDGGRQGFAVSVTRWRGPLSFVTGVKALVSKVILEVTRAVLSSPFLSGSIGLLQRLSRISLIGSLGLLSFFTGSIWRRGDVFIAVKLLEFVGFLFMVLQ